MKILVTGGTGFAGRFIAERLAARGHAVTVTGRTAPAPGLLSPQIAFSPVALTDDWRPVVRGMHCVVHCAFQHVPGRYRGGEGDDPQGFMRANLAGSIDLIAAARSSKVGQFVFLSSRAVYDGLAEGVAVRDAALASPANLYGLVKADIEDALSSAEGKSFRGAAIRATGIYGPAGPGRPHKWQDLFADWLAGRPVAPRVGPEVHGEDLAEAVSLIIERRGGGIFNCADITVDRRDLLAIVASATGCRHALPAAADATGIRRMDCSRLRELGWKPGGMALLDRTVRALVAPDPTVPVQAAPDDRMPRGTPSKPSARQMP
jgi:nucleoside-diphosphate-sugar epimerase